VYWDDAQPVLYLDRFDGDQPQLDDELRIWYTTYHTLEGTGSAYIGAGDMTTVRADHESPLCFGAAGYCALSRALDLAEVSGTDLYAMAFVGTWGNAKVREFRRWLDALRASISRSGTTGFGTGWQLDKWDDVSGKL
jgi:hypothetical protein